ncbi:MAG: hypothetical protein SV375_13820 [Thermodesulfobacteriota bacterium]|nr:hypothetical protein [Thermodesulfobacteriota bacterium]
MEGSRRICGIFFLAWAALGIILWGSVPAYGRDKGSKNPLPEGIYMELTRDFYEALRDEGSRRTKVHTNDPSKEYLRQIAISAQFMVETNLEILKKQERMIQLLHSILRQNKR